MLQEKRIIAAALSDKRFFTKLSHFLDLDDFSDQGKSIFKEIKSYYEIDPTANTCEVDVIKDRVISKAPKGKDLYEIIFSSLPDVSPENLIRDIVDLKRASLGQELATALVMGKYDDKTRKLLEEYSVLSEETLSKEGGVVLTRDDFFDMVNNYTPGNRIKCYPRQLNDLLKGGVFRKTHIVVFGRPELGKSTFVKNLCYGFLHQNLKVLYCGNEDPPEMHFMRMLVRLTGMTEEQILSNPEVANQLSKDRNFDKFIYKELTPGTLSEIESLCKEIKPDILVVDQIRNLYGGEKNYVLHLEHMARGIRDISKRNDLVGISITQAGDSATNKDVLGIGDIDFSNTGIPGACDLILGIGGRENEELGYRVISIPKNKISGIKVPIRVAFNPQLARID